FKILFMGRDDFSCLVLKELYAASDLWQNILVATNPDKKVGRRGSLLSVSPLKILSQTLNLPVHSIPHTKPEFRQWKLPPPFSELQMDSPNPDHLLVTASFGRILTTTQLDAFLPTRRLNVHPSLLPAYRGPAPIQHTLLNGEQETGVCVINMLKKKEGIDAGGIWGFTRVVCPVPKEATFTSLQETLACEGGKLLVSVMRDMRAGKASLQPQPTSSTLSHAPKISMADALLNFETMSAENIVQRYRAISHQVCKVSSCHDIYVPTAPILSLHNPSVWSPSSSLEPMALPTQPGSAVFHKPSKALLVRCSNNSVLSVPRVKQDGKSLLETKEWWNGV
ncbi:uncharacterized protein LACBIDRAFT_167144, partial [Laccaria bicolor S238N-H82]